MVVAESEDRRHRFGRATMKENKISKVHQVELYHNLLGGHSVTFTPQVSHPK